MYSKAYFLQNYFRRRVDSSPLAQQNFTWTRDPLLANYYILPHDCVCIRHVSYRPNTTTDSERRHISHHLNQEYFMSLKTSVRTLFPFWSTNSGLNHLSAFTRHRHMGLTRGSLILDTLTHVTTLD